MADIKDKIKKLLALAQSPNENEAKAALLKARELMAKHKMSDIDFEEQEQKLVHETIQSIKWTTDSGNIWMTDLCKVITDNYCCVAAWSHVKGTRTHTLVISGMSDDVQICKEVVKYAIGFVLNEIKIWERKNHIDHKVASASYAKGFINGLAEAFAEQEESHPEWGLVVVKPEEVKKYEDGLGSRNVRSRKASFDPLAYMKGLNDGTNFNAQKILGCAE